MYLTYSEYIEMGGTLDNAAFITAERKAKYCINACAGGQTGERIAKLTELPQAVKDCTFELIQFSADYSVGGKQISSESQSQGGQSESITYITKTDAEIEQAQEDIIYKFMRGGGCEWLLYRGACI